MSVRKPPPGAGPSGRRVWRAVLDEFELSEHEIVLLVALVRQVDRLDALESLITDEGLMVTGHGTTKVHPAVIEARQSGIAVARIAAALGLPSGVQRDTSDEDDLPRHGRARGVYAIRCGAA